MKNLMMIGNDIDNIALEIWKANTNYAVLNQSPYVWSTIFTKYIKDKPVIVVSTADQFVDKNINDVIEFMKVNNFIPVLIADNNNSIENNMYTALSEELLNAVLYIKNEKNENLNDFIKINQQYLIGKGIIDENDKTVRTSRKGKKSTSKK